MTCPLEGAVARDTSRVEILPRHRERPAGVLRDEVVDRLGRFERERPITIGATPGFSLGPHALVKPRREGLFASLPMERLHGRSLRLVQPAALVNPPEIGLPPPRERPHSAAALPSLSSMRSCTGTSCIATMDRTSSVNDMSLS